MSTSTRSFASFAFNTPKCWLVALFFCVRAISDSISAILCSADMRGEGYVGKTTKSKSIVVLLLSNGVLKKNDLVLQNLPKCSTCGPPALGALLSSFELEKHVTVCDLFGFCPQLLLDLIFAKFSFCPSTICIPRKPR